jgi:hypothetical protein
MRIRIRKTVTLSTAPRTILPFMFLIIRARVRIGIGIRMDPRIRIRSTPKCHGSATRLKRVAKCHQIYISKTQVIRYHVP